MTVVWLSSGRPGRLVLSLDELLKTLARTRQAQRSAQPMATFERLEVVGQRIRLWPGSKAHPARIGCRSPRDLTRSGSHSAVGWIALQLGQLGRVPALGAGVWRGAHCDRVPARGRRHVEHRSFRADRGRALGHARSQRDGHLIAQALNAAVDIARAGGLRCEHRSGSVIGPEAVLS
jgi:hypothetical protein